MARLRFVFPWNAHDTLGERGQVLLLVALLIPILLGFAGLAIDVGVSAANRRDTQNAADAASLAGADVLLLGGTIAEAKKEALNYVQANRFTANEATVNIPPVSGPHAGDKSYVEVLLTHQRPTVFMGVLGVRSMTQSSRAVAGFSGSAAKNYAMVVLNPTMCSSYSQSSGNTLTLNGGGVMVNSSCNPSANQGGGSKLNAQFVDYYRPGSWQLSNNATTAVAPTSVDAPIADPLASVARPTPGAASPDSGGTAANPKLKHVNSNSPTTLRPGTYYGGLKISGSGTVTFAPGLYIFAGGGFDYSGSAPLTGSGVTFFNTGYGGVACGDMALQGSGSLQLSAPTSGTYKDMLFWFADDCTKQLKYAGTSYVTTGVIYLPHASLNVSGGGALGALQIIVDSFSYSGSTSVTVNYASYVQIVAPTMKLVE